MCAERGGIVGDTHDGVDGCRNESVESQRTRGCCTTTCHSNEGTPRHKRAQHRTRRELRTLPAMIMLPWPRCVAGLAPLTATMWCWWRLLRWRYLVGCGGCRFACARVSTGPTTYPVVRLLFLFVDCNSCAGCSRCRWMFPRMNIVLCVCAVLTRKLGSASCICFAIKTVINLTSDLRFFI